MAKKDSPRRKDSRDRAAAASAPRRTVGRPGTPAVKGAAASKRAVAVDGAAAGKRAATAVTVNEPSAGGPLLSVVILAAGQGKRMKSDLPKVLQPVAGRPLLKHVIDAACALQPAAMYVVYGHGGDRVRETLNDEKVSWALQVERLGTGHAVMQATPSIPDDHVVLVLYGDVPLINTATLTELLTLCGPKKVGLLTMVVPDPTGYGRVVRNRRGQVQKVVEQKDASKQELKIQECNTGVLAAPAKLLKKWLSQLENTNSQGEYYLTDIVGLAVADNATVNPLVAPDNVEVLGVNDKAQLAEVESAYRRRAAHILMIAGVTVADPARLDVRGPVTHGVDVFLDINVILEGQVKIGNRVRIGPNTVIRNCEIGDDSEVFANCVLDGSVIGSNCRVGPFSRTRPTSTLGNSVHVGNFVEVKNSGMGNDSKANHLAYVGDAIVGERVNIGAGTIIANYDGVNKHRTIIEDDAHTGSNSVLVAPIKVGAGATIAAGSTVIKEVTPGKLTVARARQVTVENWTRPMKAKK